MKFRKRVQLFPGFRVNISKSGISTTFGTKGLSVNSTKNGMYLNTGIPGTGLYDRTKISNNKEKTEENIETHHEHGKISRVESLESEVLQSDNLLELKTTLDNVMQEKIRLSNEILLTKRNLDGLRKKSKISKFLLIGLIIPIFNKNIEACEKELQEIEEDFLQCKFNIDFELDDESKLKYDSFLAAFYDLANSNKIWDKTATIELDPRKKLSAEQGISLEIVKFSLTKLNTVETDFDIPHFGNSNGHDFYILPSFILMLNDDLKYVLLDITEVKLSFSETLLIREHETPTDSEIVDYTWLKVNKDGTPDKRFVSNKEVPICKMGQLEFLTENGLNETYVVSNYEKTQVFANSFQNYLNSIK